MSSIIYYVVKYQNIPTRQEKIDGKFQSEYKSPVWKHNILWEIKLLP